MQLGISSSVIIAVRQYFHLCLIYVNILAIILLLFNRVDLKPIFLYVEVINFVKKPRASAMLVGKPVVGLTISNYSITRFGSIVFQLPP